MSLDWDYVTINDCLGDTRWEFMDASIYFVMSMECLNLPPNCFNKVYSHKDTQNGTERVIIISIIKYAVVSSLILISMIIFKNIRFPLMTFDTIYVSDTHTHAVHPLYGHNLHSFDLQ